MNDDGEVVGERYGAMISVFFDVEDGSATASPFIGSVFGALDSGSSAVAMRNFLATVDMTDFWSYEGSVTTPPCDEGIKWNVIKQVQSISPEQLKRITDGLAGKESFAEGKGNNRAIQQLNDRTLYYSGATNMVVAYAAVAIATVSTLLF